MQNNILNASVTMIPPNTSDPRIIAKVYLEKSSKVLNGENGSFISTSYFISIPENQIPSIHKLTKKWKVLLEGEADEYLIQSLALPSGRFIRNIEVYI